MAIWNVGWELLVSKEQVQSSTPFFCVPCFVFLWLGFWFQAFFRSSLPFPLFCLSSSRSLGVMNTIVYVSSVLCVSNFVPSVFESLLLAFWLRTVKSRIIQLFCSLTLCFKLPPNHRGTCARILTCLTWGVHENKNLISFPFMMPGCCLCLVWLLARCVFLPTAPWNTAELPKIWLSLILFKVKWLP